METKDAEYLNLIEILREQNTALMNNLIMKISNAETKSEKELPLISLKELESGGVNHTMFLRGGHIDAETGQFVMTSLFPPYYRPQKVIVTPQEIGKKYLLYPHVKSSLSRIEPLEELL